MDWLGPAPLLIVSAVLFLLGIPLRSNPADRPEYRRWAGRLALVLGGIALISYFLLVLGVLLVSSEFGIVMVQGTAGMICLGAIVVGLALAIGFAVQAARSACQAPSRVRTILILALCIGLLSALRLRLLNPADPAPLQVRSLDLWWPPLLLWLSVCVTNCLLTARGVRNLWILLCSSLILPILMALRAIHRASLGLQYGDPLTLALWKVCLWLGIPALLGLGTWFVIAHLELPLGRFRHYLQIGLPAGAGIMGVLSCTLFVRLPWRGAPLPEHGFGADTRFVFMPWHLFLGWSVALALAVAVRWFQLRRTHLPVSHHIQLAGHALSIAAVATLLGSLADIFYSEYLSPLADLAILVVAGGLLLQLTGWSVFQALRNLQWKKTFRAVATPCWRCGTYVVKVLRAIPGWLGQKLKVESIPAAILKTLIGIIVLIAAAEIPNAGKTIVLPFESLEPLGLPDAEKKDVGRLVSERIVNTLGLLKQDFRTDILVLSEKNKAQTVALGGESTDLAAAVKDNDITIGNTRIPLSLLTLPIQAPVRKLLGVRVIRGTVQKEGKYYVLLVSSSTGETWRAKYLDTEITGPLPQDPNQGPVVPDAAKTPGTQNADNNSATQDTKQVSGSEDQKKTAGGPPPTQNAGKSSETQDAGKVPVSEDKNQNTASLSLLARCGDANVRVDATASDQIAKLADDVAYQVMATDPTLVHEGVISSWKAIPPFREGLRWWHEYETRNDYDALTKSIQCFEDATRADSQFTLANYRLGRALTVDRRPQAAAQVFRAVLQANPRFIPAYIALADLLNNFDSFEQTLSAALPTFRMTDELEAAQRGRRREARNLWQQVILSSMDTASLFDRGSAHEGLCPDSRRDDDTNARDSKLDSYYLAYFYCSRALQLYQEYSRSRGAASKVMNAEGNVLNSLGITMAQAGKASESKIKADVWQCEKNTLQDDDISQQGDILSRHLWRGPYDPAALRYFEQAAAFLQEDPVVRCNAASFRFAVAGDSGPMKELEGDAAVHQMLGDGYLETAKQRTYSEDLHKQVKAAGYYRLALKEYQSAITLAPADLQALNSYAYTFWEWRLNWPDAAPPAGPDIDIGHYAEKYARDAWRLAMCSASRAEQAEIQSTLGEVLLAQTRPREAIEVLEKLFDGSAQIGCFSYNQGSADAVATPRQPVVSEHPAFDEIRWDLAQAYLCAASNDRKEGAPDELVNALRSKAYPLLERIRLHEMMMEVQRFTKDPTRLDMARTQPVCQGLPRHHVNWMTVGSPRPAYELRNGGPEYDSHPPCAWLGVIADAIDENGNAIRGDLWVNIFGGGVDRGMWVGETGDGDREDVVLTDKPKTTNAYYFAQLNDKDGSPVSDVYRLPTFANEGKDTCSRNLLTLTFVQSHNTAQLKTVGQTK